MASKGQVSDKDSQHSMLACAVQVEQGQQAPDVSMVQNMVWKSKEKESEQESVEVERGEEAVALAPGETPGALTRRLVQAQWDATPADVALSPQQKGRVLATLQRHDGVFDTTLRREPMRVAAVDVELTSTGTSEYVRWRKERDPTKLDFWNNSIAEMTEKGLWRSVPDATQVAHSFLVLKPNEKDPARRFRHVVDGRTWTAATPYRGRVELNAQDVLGSARHGEFAFCFDLLQAFTQVAVAPARQAQFAFNTPQGPYTSTRMPMGWCGSTSELERRLQRVFGPLIRRGLLVWVDNLHFRTHDFEEFMEVMDELLRLCAEYNIILKPSATSVGMRHVTFAGLRLGPSTWTKVSDISAMLEGDLRTGADLSRQVGALLFFAGSIPMLRVKMEDLIQACTRCHQLAGSARAADNAKVPLDAAVGWSPALEAQLRSLWREAATAASLTLPTGEGVVLMISDASATGGGVLLGELPEAAVDLPLDELLAQLRIFYLDSFMFKANELNWTTTERELWPLVWMTEKAWPLLTGRRIVALTDHADLIPLLNKPGSLLKPTSVKRVTRWVAKMGQFDLECRHIAGEANMLADALSRHHGPGLISVHANRLDMFLRVLEDPAAAWPSPSDLERDWDEADDRAVAHLDAVLDASGWWRTKTGLRYVPVAWRKRLTATAHTVWAGHRGVRATTGGLLGFTWPGMQADVKRWVHECVHCRKADPPAERRTFQPPTPRKAVGDLWSVDLVDMGAHQRAQTPRYVLVFTERATGYIWAEAVADTGALTATRALERMIATLGVTPVAMRHDNASTFDAPFTSTLQAFGIVDESSVAYASQTNGVAERALKDLIRGVRTFVSDKNLDSSEWDEVLMLAVRACNLAKREGLGGWSAVELFLGKKGTSMGEHLERLWKGREARGETPQWTKEEWNKWMQDMQEERKQLEQEAVRQSAKRQADTRYRREMETGSKPNDLEAGDVVLQSTRKGRNDVAERKSVANWEGPKRVQERRGAAYVVEDLGSGRTTEVHGDYLKKLGGSDMELGEEWAPHIDHNKVRHYNVEKMMEMEKRPKGKGGQYYVKVRWAKPYTEEDDSWEPLLRLARDVPQMVDTYLEERSKSAQRRTETEDAIRRVKQSRKRM